MKKLAAGSGVVIYEDGQKIYIYKTPASWTSVFSFVTGLLSIILLANAIWQLIAAGKAGESSSLGLILLAISVLFLFVFWRVWVYRKRKNQTPVHELPVIAIVDFEKNILLDEQGTILSPLTQAWLTRKMQLTSSSPELMIQWKGGSLSLIKGNPFSGGMAHLEQILVSKGIRKR